MEIIQTTKITLEDAEMSALETIKSAYIQCLSMDCYSCDDCPLYVVSGCIGMFAEKALERIKEGK